MLHAEERPQLLVDPLSLDEVGDDGPVGIEDREEVDVARDVEDAVRTVHLEPEAPPGERATRITGSPGHVDPADVGRTTLVDVVHRRMHALLLLVKAHVDTGFLIRLELLEVLRPFVEACLESGPDGRPHVAGVGRTTGQVGERVEVGLDGRCPFGRLRRVPRNRGFEQVHLAVPSARITEVLHVEVADPLQRHTAGFGVRQPFGDQLGGDRGARAERRDDAFVLGDLEQLVEFLLGDAVRVAPDDRGVGDVEPGRQDALFRNGACALGRDDVLDVDQGLLELMVERIAGGRLERLLGAGCHQHRLLQGPRRDERLERHVAVLADRLGHLTEDLLGRAGGPEHLLALEEAVHRRNDRFGGDRETLQGDVARVPQGREIDGDLLRQAVPCGVVAGESAKGLLSPPHPGDECAPRRLVDVVDALGDHHAHLAEAGDHRDQTGGELAADEGEHDHVIAAGPVRHGLGFGLLGGQAGEQRGRVAVLLEHVDGRWIDLDPPVRVVARRDDDVVFHARHRVALDRRRLEDGVEVDRLAGSELVHDRSGGGRSARRREVAASGVRLHLREHGERHIDRVGGRVRHVAEVAVDANDLAGFVCLRFEIESGLEDDGREHLDVVVTRSGHERTVERAGGERLDRRVDLVVGAVRPLTRDRGSGGEAGRPGLGRRVLREQAHLGALGVVRLEVERVDDQIGHRVVRADVLDLDGDGDVVVLRRDLTVVVVVLVQLERGGIERDGDRETGYGPLELARLLDRALGVRARPRTAHGEPATLDRTNRDVVRGRRAGRVGGRCDGEWVVDEFELRGQVEDVTDRRHTGDVADAVGRRDAELDGELVALREPVAGALTGEDRIGIGERHGQRRGVDRDLASGRVGPTVGTTHGERHRVVAGLGVLVGGADGLGRRTVAEVPLVADRRVGELDRVVREAVDAVFDVGDVELGVGGHRAADRQPAVLGPGLEGGPRLVAAVPAPRLDALSHGGPDQEERGTVEVVDRDGVRHLVLA